MIDRLPGSLDDSIYTYDEQEEDLLLITDKRIDQSQTSSIYKRILKCHSYGRRSLIYLLSIDD